jgi:DNA-binding MarR family transcriptional regulator
VSWDAVKRVLELGPSSGLTDREFRVLLVLADRLNKRTGQLNPAARRIARDIGLEPDRTTVRNVRRTIAALERQGWLQRIGSSKGGQDERGRYLSQSYRLRDDLQTGVSSGHPSRVSETTTRGVVEVPTGVSSGHPNLGSRTTEENLRSGSTTPLASPRNSNASTKTPSRSGRISDALLDRVRELDPDAERKSRYDGSHYIELSDGEELPNSTRAEMWCRYSPEARYS